MKKTFLLLCSCILLSGCGKSKVEEPYQVNVNGHILSYYDTKDTIDEDIQSEITIYEGLKILKSDGSSPIEIAINKDGGVRWIIINSPDIVCYPNISVGDDKTKIEKAFSYEYSSIDGWYTVLFNGSTETERKNKERKDIQDNWLLLDFKIDDNNKISQIWIYDVLYAEKIK